MIPEHAITIDMLIEDIIKYYEWGGMKLDQAYIIAIRDYSITMISILMSEANKPSEHDLMLIQTLNIMLEHNPTSNDIRIILSLYRDRK